MINMMIENPLSTIPLVSFENLSRYNGTIKHFLSTRKGGISSFEYNTLNLGLNQADIPVNVQENRTRLAREMKIDYNSFVFARQVHGTKVVRVYESDRGRGLYSRATAFPFTDGMVTNAPNICLITLAADCVPLLFFDPVKKAIGVAHAGWKGTVLKISSVIVKKLQSEFGSDPNDLIIGIGPSAGPCCYEVGTEVVSEVKAAFSNSEAILNGATKPEKAIFNLWEANRLTLLQSGVRDENIEVSNRCTICSNDTFFSARKGDLGRFGAGIMLL